MTMTLPLFSCADFGTPLSRKEKTMRTKPIMNIFEAIRSRSVENVRPCVEEQGADVNMKDSNVDEFTPLHYAVLINSNMKVLKCLVSKGADVNARDDGGSTVLHYAATRPNLKTVKFLVSKGSNVHLKNADGCTPLHDAVEFGNDVEVSRYLIVNGASIDEPNNEGMTPFDLAVKNPNEEVGRFFFDLKKRQVCEKITTLALLAEVVKVIESAE